MTDPDHNYVADKFISEIIVWGKITSIGSTIFDFYIGVSKAERLF